MFSSILSEESIAKSFVLLFLQKKPTIPFTCLRVIQVSLSCRQIFSTTDLEKSREKKANKE